MMFNLKKLTIMALGLISISSLVAFASCDSQVDESGECSHNYGQMETIEPTCTHYGYTEYCCTKCGAYKEDDIVDALGHSYGEAVVVEATCGEAGTSTTTCSVCGDVNVEAIEATGEHTAVVDEAVASTCTETGLTEGSHCSVCGQTIVAQEVVATSEHNYVNGTCSICGESDPDYVDSYTVINTISSADFEETANSTKTDYTSTTLTFSSYISYTCIGKSTIMTSEDDTTTYYLNSGGKTSDSNGRYFTLDLSALSGMSVKITAVIASNSSDARSAYITTLNKAADSSAAAQKVLATATSSSQTDLQTLTYTTEADEYTTLYIVFSASVNVYSIEIAIDGELTETACEHTSGMWMDAEDGTHYFWCYDCDAHLYSDAHTYENGECTVCYATDPDYTTGEEVVETEYTLTVDGISGTVVEDYPVTITVADAGTYEITSTLGDIKVICAGIHETLAYKTLYEGDSASVALTSGQTFTIQVSTMSDYSTCYFTIAKVVEQGDDGTVDEPTSDSSVTYAVANTTDGYVATYSGSDTTSVTLENTASTFKEKSKSTSDSSVTYTYYAECKASKYVKITIADGVVATVTIYASHTTTASVRTLYIGTDTTTTTDISLSVGGSDEGSNSTSYLHALNATLSSGTYYVWSDETMHIYAIIINYSTSGSDSGESSESGAVVAENNATLVAGVNYVVSDGGYYYIEGEGTYTITVVDGGDDWTNICTVVNGSYWNGEDIIDGTTSGTVTISGSIQIYIYTSNTEYTDITIIIEEC